MDVRPLVLPVSPSSAVALPGERLCGLPKRGLALLLANVMFWQPLWAQADGIVVSAPGTTLDHAGNGVPIVNIAAPNGSGLSHNQFRDFNVGTEGLLLNNATQREQSTQLGGIILGNPNLRGTAAQIILNEVNGGSPSQLRGYTEVAGQSARVIVANPYGISCSGCGFINTPRVTLTTGKPVLSGVGAIDHYQVDGGSVTIDGPLLNASNVDRFEIITRSAKLNANLQAKNLAIIAGRNNVNAESLAATPRASDGMPPQLAIDSSALGGMYAGTIKLVGTEAGVGVRLAGNLAASAGDIQIDANGHLSLAQAASANAINIHAASLDAQGPVYAGTALTVQTQGTLSNQQSLAARDNISLTAGGVLTNTGIIEAGVNSDNSRNTTGDVSLSGQNLRNAGSVVASRNLDIAVSQGVDNRGGTLSGKSRTQLNATSLDNRAQGRLLSSDSLTLNVNQVLNNQGLINSRGILAAQLGYLDNSGGEFSSQAAVYLNVTALDNVAGLLMAGQNLSLSASGALNNHNGRLGASQAVSVASSSLDNSQNGLLSAGSTLDLSLASLDNRGGVVNGGGSTRVTATEVLNTQGRIASQADLQANISHLSQQSGELVAQGNLNLSGSTLDNRTGGLVASAQNLSLNVGNVDNRSGELSSAAALSLSGQQLNNSDGGKVLAGTHLGLTVAQVLNQNQGLLYAKGQATMTGQQLDNSGGRLSALSALNIQLDGALNNLNGLISSEGTLTVGVASLNNRQGSLSSAGLLKIASAGLIDNQGGQLVTDAGLNLSSLSLDNSNTGSINGKGPLTLTTGALNNNAGNLSSGSDLTLKAGPVSNQNNGRIASAGALNASVNGLEQQGGRLFSNTRLSLDLNHGQLNNQNGLITAPVLVLNNLNGVNNQQGEISSAQAFTLAANSLDNSNGKLLSNQSLTLRINQALSNVKGLIAAAALEVQASSVDNSGGTLTSRGNLDLKVSGLLDNQNQGLINATQQLTINSAALHNQNGGSLLGSAIALDFGAATGDLNNAGGLITTNGQLSIEHLRDLNNQGGELSSQQSFSLSGRSLDNTSGKLISSQQLDVHGIQISNQNGLISGWSRLQVSAADLDNRNNGTLSSRNGDLLLDVSGSLLNRSGGAVVTQKQLIIHAGDLDNSQGGILSSGGRQTLSVVGLLNNSQGGLIDSGAELTLQATTLDNHSGSVSTQQALDVSGTSVDNSGGQLIGNGAVSLTLLQTLINSNGKLASAGPLRLSANQVNNQGGQLASQGVLTLLTGGLDNRNRGTVAANNVLTLTATGTVDNGADGLIYSQRGDVNLRAASLVNDQGTLQSQGAMTLAVAGDINNQRGRILAQDGELTLNAANLANQSGVLASLHATLTATLSGWLRNGLDLFNQQGGITQAERLNLTALGGIDNQGGRIAAQTGDAIVNTAVFDNRSGGLYAAQRINVSGSDLDNRSGQIAGQQIDLNLTGALRNALGIVESDSTLSIGATSVDNQNGQLRALGTSGATQFQIGGLFDNRNGTVESANTDLTLGAGSFLNAGGTLLHVGHGTFAIDTALLTDAGGSLITRGGLTLSADSWSNSSILQAGRLVINVNHLTQTASGQLLAADSLVGRGVNWSNDGLIASDGSLDVGLSGLYSGNGRLSSLGDLTLSAGQLDLAELASIASGGDSLIRVGGLLNNRGRLMSAANLTLNAGSVNNYGTLGSGQDLTLTTAALLNDHGLLFSGWDMGLRVDSLTNSYASIYSLGDLAIDRDGLGGWASNVVNSSGLIQSDGSLSLAASTIQNIRALLTVSNGGIYTAKIEQIQCIEGVNAGDCGGKRNRVWEITQRDKLEVTAASAASSITAGGNLTIKGGDLLNASSSFATGGNFTATLNNLSNIGVETSDTETVRVFITERSSGDGWSGPAQDFTERYWFESSGYDFNNLGGLTADMSRFIGTTESELTQFNRVTQLAAGDQTYAAIIQAAGNVSITTQNNFDNSVVRNGFDYVGSGPQTNTNAPDSEFSTRITLNQQLPPDLAQQQVNPLALPGFELPTGQNGLFRLSGQGSTQGDSGPSGWNLGGASVDSTQRQQDIPGTPVRGIDSSAPATPGITGPLSVAKVQGLPSNQGQSNAHKYLIETNPVLTDLKQFMSSDYLLGNLGYNPDDSAKRLGDGFYEQSLIQQAVVARTGQRFLDGLTSDEDMFRYLMDNAIASKDALHLSLGVSLTAEQVAALTHDIVWMETVVVNGEEVLVPVLYLAQANNRLAANGALIIGKDVNLIAGKDLSNAGTLKASDNLAAMAGNNLINSGLVQAGNRLDLLAGNDLTNKAGGIIKGRDVSLTSVTGDILNERTVTGYDSSNGFNSQHRDFVDNAARIEAANDLTIQAGRDFSNIGGVLQSGRDTRITAGRDVTLGSATAIDSNSHGSNNRDLSISQNGSSLEVGRDLAINAGRDLTLIASDVNAKRDLTLSAARDLTAASAADEEHSYSKSKKVTAQEDHVSQVGSSVTAGGDVVMTAGQDLTLISSKVNAGDEAYLVAGGNLELLAAQDSDYSLYDMKKKGGFGGSSQTQRDETTDVKNIGSEIKTGGDLTLVSGGDQRYQGAKLKSGGDLTLDSGGDITFEAVKDLHQESHEKSKGDLAWNSASGKGTTDETMRQSELIANGQTVINAVNGLHIDLKQIDQKTVSETIDAMVQADPSLAWLKEAEARGDVNWQQVKEIHDSFKYNDSGLGIGAQLAIAILVTYLTWGAGSSLVGAAANSVGGAAANSVVAAVATKTATSTVDNRGNLSDVAADVTSSDSLKGYVIAGVSGGVGTVNSIGLQLAVNSALKTVLQGGKFKDNLAQAAVIMAADALSGYIYQNVGDALVGSGLATKVAVHAIVGGLIGEAAGGDFRTAALAAGANEALLELVGKDIFPGDAHERLIAMTSQLIGISVAAAAGGSEKDQEKAGWVAQQAAVYNFLTHEQQNELAQQLDKTCHSDVGCIKNTLKSAKPLADKQNGFSPAEQAEYDNAQDVLTDKLLSNCQSAACVVRTSIQMQQAGLACGTISCLRETAGEQQIQQYVGQGQWGKLALDFGSDLLTVFGALGIGAKAGAAVDDAAKGNSVAEALTSVTQKQLDKKFKHASDFGVVTTKKNPETLAQYESAIKTHMGSTSTTQQGTYGFVKDSKVFFNSTTNNAVVLDASGNFVTGFKLSPGTQQFENFIKNGVLR
jgi:filamentous hemagglutinin